MTTDRTSGRKTKRRKTIRPPRRSATTANAQTSDKKKIALLTRELSEALEQQAATSEILRVIGESHADVQPVFETLARNAVRLCGAEHASIWRFDGRFLRVVATHNVSAERRDSSSATRSLLDGTALWDAPVFSGAQSTFTMLRPIRN